MNRRTIIALIALVVVIVAGISLANNRSNDGTNTGQNGQAPNGGSSQPTSTIQSGTNATSTGNQQNSPLVVDVSGQEFSFTPAEIRAKRGQPVKIRLSNPGRFPHDFVVDEFNARTPVINAGQTAEVTFTPGRTGTFEYYCSVGNHRQMGMRGNLIVE